MDEDTLERVRDVVAAIPPGRTLSYGEVAARAGIRSARLVGRILAEDGHDLPWHRVLRADGTSAPHIAQEQAARLRAEGVLMVDGRLLPEHRRGTGRRRGATGEGRRAESGLADVDGRGTASGLGTADGPGAAARQRSAGQGGTG